MEQKANSVSPLNRRLVEVRIALGLNQEDFATFLNVSRSYLSNIEAGRREVPFEAVTLLVGAKNVSAHWFHTGEGLMFQKAPKHPSPNPSLIPSPNATNKTKGTKKAEREPAQTDNLRILVATVDSRDRENIALVSTRVAAGYADGGFMNPEFMKDLPSFSLPDSAYKNATFRAFQVSGDSMQPTLWEGDWVICRFIDHWNRDIRDTFVHVIVTDDRPVVKRLLNRLNERGQLTLQSDNPAYPAQFLDGERVREVWVAVGRLSRQFANPRYDLIQEVSRSRADIDELMLRLDALEQRPGRVTRLKNLD
jgi:phage repressor protein C with HTH and peptisase S24 domain